MKLMTDKFQEINNANRAQGTHQQQELRPKPSFRECTTLLVKYSEQKGKISDVSLSTNFLTTNLLLYHTKKGQNAIWTLILLKRV